MSACRYVGRVGGWPSPSVSPSTPVPRWPSADSSPTCAQAAGPATAASHSAPARAQAPRAGKPAAAQATRRAAAPRALSVAAVKSVAPATTAVSSAAALTQPEIMGPSGVPIPSQNYVDKVMEYYVRPGWRSDRSAVAPGHLHPGRSVPDHRREEAFR